MKKILTVLILIAICQKGNAQDFILSLGKKDFIAADIVMNDGKMISGFIKDFTLPNTIEFRGLGFEFKAIESQLRLDLQKFKFKREPNGPVENLELADIQTVTLKAEDTIKFERLKLKTINSDLEIVDLNREIMAPLIREGKINLYGLKAYECSNTCELMFVIAYIKNPEDAYAYIPIDFNRVNIFNIGKIDDKLLRAFEETGKDCPEFLAYLKKNQAYFENKEDRKEMKNEYKQFQKETKEKLKQVKGARGKRKMYDDLITEYFLQFYLNLIDAYANRCN